MRDGKFYCNRNVDKINSRYDLTHINAHYSKLFYLELNSAIIKYIKDLNKSKKRRLTPTAKCFQLPCILKSQPKKSLQNFPIQSHYF